MVRIRALGLAVFTASRICIGFGVESLPSRFNGFCK